MKLLSLLISAVLLFSCGKEEKSINADYFIFGDFYGECAGDCARLYKIEDEALYADNIDNLYSANNITFSSSPLPSEKYQKAQSLVGDFPEFLWESDSEVFGMPDAYDQGGVRIILSRDGEEKQWTIDNDTGNIPENLRDYTEKIQQVLSEL